MDDGPYAPPGATYGAPPLPAPPARAQSRDDPRTALATAAARASLAVALLWALCPTWLLIVVAGAYAGSAEKAIEDGNLLGALSHADAVGGMVGLFALAALPLGGGVWALLALWASWTARAARAAGRGRETGRSHLAWWGLFLPFGGAVLPALAYAQAARFGDSARHRRAGATPRLLLAWWALVVLALGLTFTGLSAVEQLGELDPALGRQAALMVAGGLVGVLASAVGAVAVRRAARTAREAARG